MKHILLLVAFFGVMSWTSCTNSGDDDNSGSNGGNTTIAAGLFKVSSYIDKGRDRTSNYTGMGFDFKSNRVVTATKGSTVINGTWQQYLDSGKTKMDLLFPDQLNLDEFNEDWVVVSNTTNEIKLTNVSGGDGGLSTLVFTK
jgi:hypothetical protein